MIAMQQAVDYQYVRSVVREVFATNGSPYAESPMADMINDKPARQDLGICRTRYPGQSWNTSVHASESRRPGRSKMLFDRADSGKARMRRRVEKLHWLNQSLLRFMYDSNSLGHKHTVKTMVWQQYAPKMDGCNIDTKATANVMLDQILSEYREGIMQGKTPKPRKVWLEYTTMTEKTWYATHKKHWEGLRQALESLDCAVLDLIR